MAQAVTFVPSENDTTTITTQVGDTVYVLDAKHQYKHTAHIVKRVRGNEAVTECTTWAHWGTVALQEKDCFIWCENGCMQAKRAQESN
jgi:hypothetical protein